MSATPFHVIMVTSKDYTRISSHADLREAADATVIQHKRFRCSSAVLRDGRTGARYSVGELIDSGCVSDSVLDAADIAYRDPSRAPAALLQPSKDEDTKCLECGKSVEPHTLACEECLS